MHLHRTYHLALAMLALYTLVATLLAGVISLRMQLTIEVAVGALALAGVLVAAIAYVHDALRAARWDAGHRLR